MLAFLTIPATVGLMVLGAPVVRLLYERGRFTAADTQQTATALLLYSIGLVGYTGVKVLAPAFYALGTPRVPARRQRARGRHEPRGDPARARRARLSRDRARHGARLAAERAPSWLLVFERRLGGLFGHGLFRSMLRMAFAAAVMGALAHMAASTLEGGLGRTGLAAQLATGLVPVVAGVVLYLALTHLLRVGEAAGTRGARLPAPRRALAVRRGGLRRSRRER